LPPSPQDPDTPLTTYQICFAGGFSAIPATILTVPIERIKCVLQFELTQPKHKRQFHGPFSALREIWREGGLRSVYCGTTATILRDVPNSVVYFGTYEYVKQWLLPPGKTEEDDLGILGILCAGGVAGMVSELVSLVGTFGTLHDKRLINSLFDVGTICRHLRCGYLAS
jgi:solute carrier family 25 carnitine/acylcarnitine transporter 20/29